MYESSVSRNGINVVKMINCYMNLYLGIVFIIGRMLRVDKNWIDFVDNFNLLLFNGDEVSGMG